MKIGMNSFVWEQDFPDVYGQTSISFLKQCRGFAEAKNGDLRAANSVVVKCVNPQSLAELRRRYPDAEILPVITDNKLPLALAQAIGLRICKTVFVHKNRQRKHMRAMERLLHPPTFEGAIKHRKNYILVDDIMTQGGTISSLRKHVISGGGNVVAVVVLACAAGGSTLTPEQNNILLLSKKFGSEQLNRILQKYSISNNPHELTNRQAQYLLRFKEIDNIVEKINYALANA